MSNAYCNECKSKFIPMGSNNCFYSLSCKTLKHESKLRLNRKYRKSKMKSCSNCINSNVLYFNSPCDECIHDSKNFVNYKEKAQ